MSLPSRPYLEQCLAWPADGEHVLAHHDADTIIVYQAYRHSIGTYAIRHGRLGGPDFSLDRMSWIKPNFLWMMYRCGWGTKEGQEVVLGLRLRRTFFDHLMAAAVPSTFDPRRFACAHEWKTAVAASDVRCQWDPDHSPSGGKLSRRAIQLGLRGAALRALAGEELLEVIDMTGFVQSQRVHAQDDSVSLETPVETVYLWRGAT